MPHSTTVSYDGKFIQRINRNIDALPKEFRAEYKRRTRNPIRNLRRKVTRTPSRVPRHPFIWSLEASAQARARRWWFAAIAGRIPGVKIQTSGGRYKRTGKGPKGVKIIFDRKEGTITIEIKSDRFAKYVIGSKQVPSHKLTGWPRADKEIEKAEVKFLDNAIKVWDDITNKVIDK